MSNKFWSFYISVFVLLTLFSYLFIDVNFSYLHSLYTGFFMSQKSVVTFVYLLFITVLSVGYLSILKKSKDNKKDFAEFRKPFLAVILILLFSYPAMLSYDIFTNIAYAKIFVAYRENPLIMTADQFPHDPFFAFARYTNIPIAYGFSWVILSAIPYILGFGNYLLTLFQFKLFTALFFIGTLFVLHKLSKGNKETALLFAFNPLVLITVLQSAHNDIIMMFLALLSYYFVMKKRIWLAILFLILSIFIKYVTIALLPVFIYMLYKHLKKETINWEKTFLISAYLMIFMFLISFIHRELYPWYGVWFLPFIYLVPQRKKLLYFAQSISLGLLLSDLPYLYLEVYSKLEIVTKYVLIFLPMIIFSPVLLSKRLQKIIAL